MSVVRYRYRLRPGAVAVAALLCEWDRCRWVWNQAVARLNESGQWVRDDALTGWRREHDWLREGSVVTQQQMLRNFRAERAKGKGRQPARGERASQGYLGAKRAVAELSKKVARQRQDTARKWATKIVANYGVLAVEDFKPRFLAKSRMARKSAGGAIGATKATLIEYARRAGRKVVLVSPAYTTMTCSDCGARAKSRLLLSARVFVCEFCGMIEDRDRNAARVMLDRAGLNPAGVEAVRHPDLLEVRVLAEPGIPAP